MAKTQIDLTDIRDIVLTDLQDGQTLVYDAMTGAFVNGSGGGGGSPAGEDTQIQFNDSGSFGASENLAFDGTTLTVPAVNISTANPVLAFTETGGGSNSNFQQAPNGDFSLSMTGPDNQVLGFDGTTGEATFLASVSAAELHAVNGASGTGTTITAITVEDGIIRSITVS